jgi:hypothetical protein
MAKPGEVVSIRVNPTDIMSVIDLCDSIGVDKNKFSFPAMVSLALSSMLQAMREQKIIPERDGFEYNDITSGVLGSGQNKVKRAATTAILHAGSNFRVKPPPAAAFVRDSRSLETFQNGTTLTERSEAGPSPAEAGSSDVISTEQRLARRRLSELVAKQDMIESGAPGLVWSASDQREYDELYKEVYG